MKHPGQLVAALLVFLGIAAYSDSASVLTVAESSNTSTFITGAVPPAPGSIGEIFFDKTFNVAYGGGQLLLSSSWDGAGWVSVDDRIIVTVTRPDLSTAVFDHRYDVGPCSSLSDVPPHNITSLFQSGTNQVRVQFQDACGGGLGSTPYWLVQQAGAPAVQLNWSRSAESGTISCPGIGQCVDQGRLLDTPITDVWDNGTFTPLANKNATPPGSEWASWPQTNPIDVRHFRATFEFSTVMAPSTITGNLRSPYYSSDLVPINDNLYIFVSGVLKFTGGTSYGATNGGLSGSSLVSNETDGWYVPGGIPVSGFLSGINAIDIIVEERAAWGGLGRLELRLDLPPPPAYQFPFPDDSTNLWKYGALGPHPTNGGISAVKDVTCPPKTDPV